MSYSGVQWVSEKYFSIEKRKGKFSIIDAWLEISSNYPVVAFEHSSNGWFDLGTEEQIRKANKIL
jgi:NDP-sugar pyrophosphorylase family protein